METEHNTCLQVREVYVRVSSLLERSRCRKTGNPSMEYQFLQFLHIPSLFSSFPFFPSEHEDIHAFVVSFGKGDSDTDYPLPSNPAFTARFSNVENKKKILFARMPVLDSCKHT